MQQLVTSRAPGADPGGETPKSAAPLVSSGDPKEVCFFLQKHKNDAVFVWFAVLWHIYACIYARILVFRCGLGWWSRFSGLIVVFSSLL